MATEAQSKAQANRTAYKTGRFDLMIANQAARAIRTDQQQLERLDSMFGKGMGAKKERARLLKRIATKEAKGAKDS